MVASKITDKLVKFQVVHSEEKDLYVFGFYQGFILLFNILTVIAIGVFFGMIWKSIFFVISYSFLRAYAGGYHASTQVRCYLVSVSMITVVLWIIKMVPWSSYIYFIIMVVSSGGILILAPREDSNKPLDQKEKIVYRKRTIIVLSALIGLSLLFWFIGQQKISISIVTAMLVLSFMLGLGKIKNMFGGKGYV